MTEEKPRKSYTAPWIYSTVAALLLYVLGSGPMEILSEKRTFGITLDMWLKCYTPLLRVCQATNTSDWFVHYVNWCATLLTQAGSATPSK